MDKKLNFKDIDRKIRYKNKELRLMAANRDGYTYISEHIVMTYNDTKSLRETGKQCGDISTIAVRSVLSKCKIELRSPGGRVWSKLSEEDVRYIRSFEYTNNKIFMDITKEVESRMTKRTGENVTISIETIRDVWKKKTHKSVK